MKSNLFETLRHKRRHKYVSSHVLKGPPKSPLVLPLSNPKYKQKTTLLGYILAGTRVLFLRFAIVILAILTLNDVFRLPCKFDTSFRSVISPNEVANVRLGMFMYLGDRIDNPPIP